MQEEAFQSIKRAVTSAPVLKYFNSADPVEGQGDASSIGIGFVLMQNGQPVSYSSRALTASKENYSQIEKEPLDQYLEWSITITLSMVEELFCGLTISRWRLFARNT